MGLSATATASGLLASISDLRVNLSISGGYNGDLYVYLSHDGAMVPLLNRVGVKSGDAFGYADFGFNVTFSSTDPSRKGDVHDYETLTPSFSSGRLTGIWEPDGRSIDPEAAPGDLYDSTRVSFASRFEGLNPNGTWTLFIADLSAGGQSHLEGWSLDVTAVPEPVNVALGIFAGVLLVVTLVRRQQLRKRFYPKESS